MGISEISKPSIYGKIEKLKKNCEKVPIELLRTKYRKPYMELLEGIRDDITMVIYTTCFTFPLAVGSSEEEKKELMEGSRKLIREIAADGVMNEVRDAVFKNYDMDGAFLIIAKKICFRSWYEVFAPYWIRHCRMDPDGRIRNDIIGDDYSYSFDSGVWISEKSGSATMLLPPTMDLIEKERREYE